MKTTKEIGKSEGLLEFFNGDYVLSLSGKDRDLFLSRLREYYIEYRSKLGFGVDLSFGVDFDIVNFGRSLEDFSKFKQTINASLTSGEWEFKNLERLVYEPADDGKFIFGLRACSPSTLTNTEAAWEDIKNVCGKVSKRGSIDKKCFSSVYGGAEILGDNPLYWYRFIKMITVYENIIYRFMYGEYLTPAFCISERAKSGLLFYESKLDEIYKNLDKGVHGILEIINSGNGSDLDKLRLYGVSFWKMLKAKQKGNTFGEQYAVEVKGNPTINPIILQNNINFLIRLMLYCKSSDILNKRRRELDGILGDIDSYARVYFEQAVELSNMIYDSAEDKINFLGQYVKANEEAPDVRKSLELARRFTKNVIHQ